MYFYMLFLDAWVIVLSIYEYFLLFSICLFLLVYSLRFKKKKNLFKIIYLSIYFSRIGLDVRLNYDSIDTIVLGGGGGWTWFQVEAQKVKL